MKRLREMIRRWLGDPRLRASFAGATGAALLLIGAGAQASSGSGHGSGEPHLNVWEWDGHAPPVGWAAINLVIFLGLLYKFALPAVKAMFKRRHEEVKALVESSEKALQAAKAELDEYQQKLATVEQEANKLREGAKRDGAEDRDRIIAAAKDYAARLRRDTDAVVEQEAAIARRRLREKLVEQVLAEAQALLNKTLTAADQERLLNASIEELEAQDARELRRAV